MDLAVKVGLMLLAMGALYGVAQRFSDSGESAPRLPLAGPSPLPDARSEEAVVVQRKMGDSVIQNYGFRTIDLRTGPPDPTDFFDELYLQFYTPGASISGYSAQLTYTVCTPTGLERKMREEHWVSICADGYIVVERYDLDVILDTILDQVAGRGEDTRPDQLVPPPPRVL